MLSLIVLVFAFVLAVIAAFWNTPSRPHFGWLAFALYLLCELIRVTPGFLK